jgi:aspartate/methionine/tyrosine aminotransferase
MLRQRRDACVAGLNAIDGIDVATPNSTFYIFPNVTRIMSRKGLHDVNDLMVQALQQTNVSFCTRNHFGRPVAGEKNDYIRFAYSGLEVADINEGMEKLKVFFER